MRSKYIILPLCFLSFYSLAGREEASLVCQEITKTDEKHVILSGNELEFQIKNPRRDCDSVFSYEEIALPKKKWMITSWPTDNELGLNAQRDLFIASSMKSEANYIGSIPVDATTISTGRYRGIAQSGGSIYETIYILGETSIKIKSPGRELIFSDTSCIYKEQNSDLCHPLTGTFDNPLCVHIHNERKILTDLSNCSELLPSK